jgi:acetyl-CoA decarbonylase/synthase complex subunit epsilon
MTLFEPWKTGNVFGPITAVAVGGEVAGEIIRYAHNPLFITGALILKEEAGGKKLDEYAIEIARKLVDRGCVTVATANSGITFKDKVAVKIMGVVEVVDRLQDAEWGANDKPHDLVVTLGIHYWLASQALSTLKHFAPHLKTLSLCNMNHPNANWSFSNIDREEWEKSLKKVIQKIG